MSYTTDQEELDPCVTQLFRFERNSNNTIGYPSDPNGFYGSNSCKLEIDITK